MKKYIAGLLLLAFAVPSWAEEADEFVFYCTAEKTNIAGPPKASYSAAFGGDENANFKVKIDTESEEMFFRGDPDFLLIRENLPCISATCNKKVLGSGLAALGQSAQKGDMQSVLGVRLFSIYEEKFIHTEVSRTLVKVVTGTCTKF